MKKKTNAMLRRAASLHYRTDAAIDRLGKTISDYERGIISARELLREASDAANRAGNLELSKAELAATGSFGRSVNRKVKAYRGYIRTAARIAMGFKSDTDCRRKVLELARTAVKLGNRQMAMTAHDLIWIASSGLPSEMEYAAFEAIERIL